MTKTVSLRIDEKLYNAVKILAEAENRSISNFIETAAIRYIDEVEYADDFEMENLNIDKNLQSRIKQGISDAENNRGRFV